MVCAFSGSRLWLWVVDVGFWFVVGFFSGGVFFMGFWVYGQWWWWVSMWVGFAVVVMGSNGVVGLL